ncbi:hypothetical protein LT85_0224 [Collimonas arenae]|uniref:Uncharacterized protein n=1 Tax=Collimonas arenae TaxID=279058 RepID=A0A0A1F6T1_9BURK|nr:hypothetical protein LT85_0224 [Collimonas arenae]
MYGLIPVSFVPNAYGQFRGGGSLVGYFHESNFSQKISPRESTYIEVFLHKFI